jgi:hypothetical protein
LSTNRRWDKNGVLPTLIPLKFVDFFASIRSLLSPLATITKSKGGKGNYSLRPFLGLQKDEVDPLIGAEKDIEIIQLITQFMKESSKQTWITIIPKYS